jgi:hypothetical protein
MITLEDVKGRIAPILRRRGVKRAALFGSLARGEVGEGSDIDLVVEFRDEKSLLDLVSLKLELESELDVKVDVLTYNALNPHLKRIIMEEQVAIL